MPYRTTFALLAVACCLAAAACTTPQQLGAAMHNTITLAEANRIADEYVEKGRRALSPDARLGEQLLHQDLECSDTGTGVPIGTYQVQRIWEIVGLTPPDPAVHFGSIRRWWAANNFRITADSQDSPERSTVIAENNTDHFAITFDHNQLGKFYLSVSSPCVWRNGTPEQSP